MIPFFRTEYNYDRNEASQETALYCKDASRTKQEFAADADINTIIERFGIGYDMPLNTTPPASGDFTEIPDFRGAVDIVRRAQEVFNALPAKIRSRFENDAGKYVEFFNDPDNYEEARKLGLVKEPEEVQTPPEPPKDPAKPESKTG